MSELAIGGKAILEIVFYTLLVVKREYRGRHLLTEV